MADISNQFHNAVDTVLSFYAKQSGSQACLKEDLGDPEDLGAVTENKTVLKRQESTRTTIEVVNSLQRPEVEEFEREAIGKSELRHEHSSRMKENFLAKVSAASSSGKQKMVSRNAVTEVIDTLKTKYTSEYRVGIKKEETLLLLSDDEFSDYEDFQELPPLMKQKAADKKSKATYVEEMDVLPRLGRVSGVAQCKSNRDLGVHMEEVQNLNEETQNRPLSAQEEGTISRKGKAALDCERPGSSRKVKMTRKSVMSISVDDMDFKGDEDTTSEENDGESDRPQKKGESFK